MFSLIMIILVLCCHNQLHHGLPRSNCPNFCTNSILQHWIMQPNGENTKYKYIIKRNRYVFFVCTANIIPAIEIHFKFGLIVTFQRNNYYYYRDPGYEYPPEPEINPRNYRQKSDNEPDEDDDDELDDTPCYDNVSNNSPKNDSNNSNNNSSNMSNNLIGNTGKSTNNH